jgi:nucleolar protein 16
MSEDKSKRGAPRFLSAGELGYLSRLVGRHGEDVEGMARDRRLNPEQRTVGELGRLVRRAGGFEGLRTHSG